MPSVPLRQICRFAVHNNPDGWEAHWGLVAGGRVWPFEATAWGRMPSLAWLLQTSEMGAGLPAELEVAGPGLDYEELWAAGDGAKARLLAPIDNQEIWAAGVTYLRSREARKEESKQGGDFYQLVYEADRPEIFFKATPNRTVGHGDEIVIRRDSEWDVPEPELTLVITPRGRIFGYTVGDDVSSRSIEGANPLYLPQAKLYAGSAAIGPVITLAHALPDARAVPIHLTVRRAGAVAWKGATSTANMKRDIAELVTWLMRENVFPGGAFLMTGTGIVPETPFTLKAADEVEIEIPGIGKLRNRVRVGIGEVREQAIGSRP